MYRIRKYIKKEIFFNYSANIPLKVKTEEGYTIFYSCILDSDPKNYDFFDNGKLMYMIADIFMHNYGTSPGSVTIFDQNNLVFLVIKKV